MNWTFKKEISIGNIISTILLMFILVGVGIKNEQRLVLMETQVNSLPDLRIKVETLEKQSAHFLAVDNALQRQITQNQTELIRILERIEDRLDAKK